MSIKYTVVIESEDGSLNVIGPFPTELAATLYGNDEETEDSGYICHVLPLESPDMTYRGGTVHMKREIP